MSLSRENTHDIKYVHSKQTRSNVNFFSRFIEARHGGTSLFSYGPRHPSLSRVAMIMIVRSASKVRPSGY